MNEDLIMSTLNRHEEILNRHEEILNRHEAILNEHTEMLKSIQKTLVIIEDCVTNKIPALFDAYKMHQDHQESTDIKIEKLDNVTQVHSLKITALEQTTNDHSKKLEKILS